MITTAVVTKRAGLALTMQSPSHRFTEVRPVTDWLGRQWTEDVLVLDLETADLTLDAIETLRESGVNSPIIVVANESDGWDEVIALHSDLFLVSLPVTPASLMVTVDRAARTGQPSPLSVTAALNLTEPAPGSELEPEPALEPEPEVQPEIDLEPDLQSAPLVLSGPASESPPETRRATRSGRTGVGRRGRVDQVPGQQARRAAPEASPPMAPPPLAAAPPEVVAATPSHRGDPVGLVRGLTTLVDRLTSVPAAAEALRTRCASAVRCEASAVLVPDGSAWRVSAGEHLRPLEERLQIDQTHWLVAEVVKAGHGVIILDTDIARTRLTGAPLASWPNLLALPVTEVGALVLLARQSQPFGRGDLTKGQRAIGQAAVDLRAALDVRSLSRALARFVDDSV